MEKLTTHAASLNILLIIIKYKRYMYITEYFCHCLDSYAMHRPEYGTSAGTRLFDRGPYNSTPVDNYPSGDGKSMIWRGPSHYVPSERRWTDYHQYRSLPRDTRRDAKEMQSEDQWVDFMRQRDTPSGNCLKNVEPGAITVRRTPLWAITLNIYRQLFKTIKADPGAILDVRRTPATV